MAAITKDIGIMELVQKYPQAVAVLQEYGMGCIGCAAAHFESVGEGAAAHGNDVDAMMESINKAVQ